MVHNLREAAPKRESCTIVRGRFPISGLRPSAHGARGRSLGWCKEGAWRPRPGVQRREPGSGLGRFLNTRAESHFHFRNLLEAGVVSLLADPEVEEEALAVEWQVNTQGKIQIVGKDLIRSTLGRSPDKLDAIVMGMFHSVTPPGREWRPVRVLW